MNLRGLDLNLLLVMDALLTERSTTRAGERIHLSQSAVSGALGRLRTFFSDELLIQVGHRMMLTPLAEELALPVREALLAIEAIVHKDKVFEPGTSTRRFRIMLSDYAATVLMTQTLPILHRAAPHIGIELISNFDAAIPALERGDVDLLLIAQQFASKAHPVQELFRDDYTCVVWTGNQAVATHLTREHYLSAGHVVARFGRDQLLSAEEQFIIGEGLERRVEVVVMGFSMLPQFVIGTSRIATLHTRLARYYAQWLPIRLLKPPLDIPPVVEVMQWHSFRKDDRGLDWIRRALAGAMSTHGEPVNRFPQ
jgi:LysR family transcriptional regulator, nod-box dependent transcriptional activator